MKTLKYRITFNTPAFLGNAEQVGQWRTPPFKALLRQWWRIAYASEHGGRPEVSAMRNDEGQLFGVATDRRNGSRKSQVRLRLNHWDIGRQRDWQKLGSVRHPEVKFPVDSGLYLGYGPLVLPKGGKQPALKNNAAIQTGESSVLSIACPESAWPHLQLAIALIDRYGTIGGRSRNGWGSFSLSTATDVGIPAESELPKALYRTWEDALDKDWPHAIGIDQQGPLIWRTADTFGDWTAVMRTLASLKIGLRTEFKFTSGNGAPKPEKRHWLSYPVTRHSVKPWRNARLPNSLRFKVRAEPDGRLRGVIVHVPCSPPADPFRPDRRTLESLWSQVYAYLDQADALTRTPE